ncbi:MAG: ATP-binding cassette domain-containing protein [Actinobacteria bacterium]|nr:ATP-binding cassette domain-containing protein [Actinomycetota bacterium]
MVGVGFTRDGRDLLDGIDWQLQHGTDWVVLGRNGSGKTTLIRIAALYEHPSRGSVRVLGQQLGRTDVRALRTRVSLVSSAMSDLMRPQLSATEIVMCGRHAALEPWWHTYTTEDRDRAIGLLSDQGVAHVADHPFGTLSSGERQRTLLARALMNRPGLVLLDEPTAGLDLRGREELVDRLDALAADPDSAPMALVTHHVEEIPSSFTHLLAVADGHVVAAGPIEQVLTAEVLSETFGIPLALDRHGRRWSARRA